MDRRVVGELSALAVLLAALAGCTSRGEDLSSQTCAELEAVGYPQLEALAESTLEGISYSLTRVGACEDTGSPRTVLDARVDQWPGRKVADRHFEQLGWVRVPSSGLLSPDGSYRVSNSTSRDADSPVTFASVRFREVADDPTSGS